MHNARKENLMKNKKKFAFLSLAIAMGMILGACSPAAPKDPSSSAGPEVSSSADESSESSNSSEESSSSSSSSSEEQVTLVSIAVTAPTKVAYTTADTALDLTGMVVTAHYSDQSTQVITSGYTVSTVDFSTAGEKTVTVTYEGKTDSFRITVANQKFTVKFVVDGTEVQTGLVEDGQLAVYSGQTPTKAADANAPKYRFIGWDRDLTQPITADTTFTAQFQAYASEIVVDDFESYSETGLMKEAGWAAYGYDNDSQSWTTNTTAAVSLATNSVEGNQALRFDAWNNNVTYMFAKTFEAGQRYDKAANAFRFRMMVPSIDQVRIIVYTDSVTVAGQTMTPWFKYVLNPTSSEYVEYTIPVTDNGWRTFGKSEEGQSMAEVATAAGIHPDDIVDHISKIEFYVQGNDGIGGQKYIAFMDSVKFVTLDDPQKAEVEKMGQYTRYTGLLNDGHTVKIELGANGAATATVVDMETPQVIQGAVEVDAQKNMTFTSADSGATLVYKAALKNGGQSMKFVSASGAFAQAVANVDLNAVQVVDNYDQYTKDGQAYCQDHMDINARSGCRGAYFSEYYSGESHDYETFGGDGWVLMGKNSDGSQLKLKTDGGHSGNNYVCMKNSGSFAMRYLQWGLFDGTSEQNNFRGSKLSFWAKTNGVVKSFKVSMYSQTKPRNATKDVQVKSQTFTQTAAIGQWKHFEIDLNPALTYYGFLVFMEKTGSSDAYLYLDDVEVYTANPYAEYVPPVQNKELVPGNAYLGKVNGLINATLKIKSATEVSLAAAGLGMTLDGTYSIAEDEFTMVVGGATYKATISDDLDKLTFVSVDGSNQVAAALNNLSFDIVRGENVESYTETGRTITSSDQDESKNKGSSGAFYIDMYKGGTSTTSPVGGSGWALTGSGAGAALNKEEAPEGSQSLKLLNSQYGNMRYIQWDLYKGTAKAMTGMTSFSVYLKNYSADTPQKVTIMAYRVQKVDSGHQGSDYRTQLAVTLPAGQDWTKYTVTLDASKEYYGFALLIDSKWNGKDFYVGADGMCFSNVENDPSLNFYGKNGLALSGDITAGPATMTFGQNGAITLNNTLLGGDLAGTYEMAMGETAQMMTVKTAMGNIVGKYAVAANGAVTFEVTEVTGDLAAGVNVGAVLSNAH